MNVRSFLAMACLSAGTLFAQSGPGPSGGGGSTSVKQVALFIPNETAPPGGLAQMKFMVTEPTPISSGSTSFACDPGLFDGVWGIELFNAAGDLNGVAMLNGSRVSLKYITSSGAQG